MTLLDKIVEYKKTVVRDDKKRLSITDFLSDGFDDARAFEQAIKNVQPSIIAEVKKASPSKGIICADFDPIEIAKCYQSQGATCLSILTDELFFQGCNHYLSEIRKCVELPLLRKDFIIDEYQVYQSRHIGADCILLITAILDDIQLTDYLQLAQELKMAVLLEVHTEEELTRALALPNDLIGINNRNLHDFTTDLNTSIRLKSLIPNHKTIITESGIQSAQDIRLMRKNGIHSFLIGEALMRNAGANLQELSSS